MTGLDCPTCARLQVTAVGGRCSDCVQDLVRADLHVAIAASTRDLRRARRLWLGSVTVFLLWPIGVLFGFKAGLFALFVGIFVAPLGIALGLSRAGTAKGELKVQRGALPQLPAARIVER